MTQIFCFLFLSFFLTTTWAQCSTADCRTCVSDPSCGYCVSSFINGCTGDPTYKAGCTQLGGTLLTGSTASQCPGTDPCQGLSGKCSNCLAMSGCAVCRTTMGDGCLQTSMADFACSVAGGRVIKTPMSCTPPPTPAPSTSPKPATPQPAVPPSPVTPSPPTPPVPQSTPTPPTPTPNPVPPSPTPTPSPKPPTPSPSTPTPPTPPTPSPTPTPAPLTPSPSPLPPTPPSPPTPPTPAPTPVVPSPVSSPAPPTSSIQPTPTQTAEPTSTLMLCTTDTVVAICTQQCGNDLANRMKCECIDGVANVVCSADFCTPDSVTPICTAKCGTVANTKKCECTNSKAVISCHDDDTITPAPSSASRTASPLIIVALLSCILLKQS